MKAEVAQAKPSFSPVAITITFESEDEAREMHAIFNFTRICDATPHLDHEAIRDAIASTRISCVDSDWKRFYSAME